MRIYFAALLLLSAGAVIEARCSIPELRPENFYASRAFKIFGRTAFAFWLVLLAYGFWKLPWWQPVAGIMGSLALNAMVVNAGPKTWWPGISMGLSLVGLYLTALAMKQF